MFHHLCCFSLQNIPESLSGNSFFSLSRIRDLGGREQSSVWGGRDLSNDCLSSLHPPYECSGSQGNGTGPHHGDEPAIFILVDTNDAGDRMKIGRGQQLQRVFG